MRFCVFPSGNVCIFDETFYVGPYVVEEIAVYEDYLVATVSCVDVTANPHYIHRIASEVFFDFCLCLNDEEVEFFCKCFHI